MKTEGWAYIRLDVHMPDHPKIDGLSDRAFRLLVTVWCRCGSLRSDGVVSATWWNKQKTSARRELIDAGLVRDMGTELTAHDYLDHQNSRGEIAETYERRRTSGAVGGRLGNHKRWHVAQNRVDPACEHCQQTDQSTRSGTDRPPISPADRKRIATDQKDKDKEKEEEQRTKTPSPEVRASAPKKILPDDLIAAFDAFWGAYPKRVGKLDAQRRFAEAVRRGVEPEAVVLGAKNYAATVTGAEERFIAHPATWLHRGSWDDSPAAEPRRATPWNGLA